MSPFPPGPKSRFPGDLLLQVRRDPLRFVTTNAAAHGDVVGFRIAGQPFALVNHPDHVRDVLVTHQKQFAKGRALERARLLLGNGLLTSAGEFHLRQRRLVQPAFHRDRIARYAEAMIEYAARTRDRWTDGETVDAHQAMMHLTLAIVAKTLFDADVDHESSEIGEALTVALASIDFAVLPGSELLQRLPLPVVIRFSRARRRLDDTVYRIIRERRAGGGDRGDLLSMLLAATDTEGDGTGMTDEQLRDEVMTLFLAGHETTANALTWTWYLLARNPHAERKLHAELDALGRAPAVEDVPRLEYARRVFAEAIRLYPPAFIYGRRALADYEVGGYVLPARTIVVMSPWLQGRDPRWFPDPERFDPDRWSPEAVAARPKFAFAPFGGGTRLCVGEQFAWMEGTLVLATLAQRWRLWLAPKQRIATLPRFTLRPRYGMRMVAGRR